MAKDPSVLLDVDVPEPLVYGKPFTIKFRFRSSGDKRIDVAVAGTSAITPDALPIDPSKSDAKGTFVIKKDPATSGKPTLIHLIFTLGASHQHRLRQIS